MEISCPECGDVRVRSRSQVDSLRSLVCRRCQGVKIAPVTCPGCGCSRRYSPSVAKKLSSPVCRKCLHGWKPKVVCRKCGVERYRGRPSIGCKLKTNLCRPCWKSEERSKWVKIECRHCGKVKELPPCQASKVVTGSCLRCARHSPGILPDNFDCGYLVGVVLGDGSLMKKKNRKGYSSYGIELMVTSEAFALKFAGTVERLVGRRAMRRSAERSLKGNEKIKMPPCSIHVHIVRITSRDWYQRLFRIKKERDFSGIVNMSRDFKDGFLRGIVDSEGYVNKKSRYTDIAGKDTGLLSVVRDVASELGYKASVYGPYSYSRGVAHLRVSGCLDKTE